MASASHKPYQIASVLTTKAYELDNFVESDDAFVHRRINFLKSINCWRSDVPEAMQLFVLVEQLDATMLQERAINSAALDAACTALDKEYDDAVRAEAALGIMTWYHACKAAKKARDAKATLDKEYADAVRAKIAKTMAWYHAAMAAKTASEAKDNVASAAPTPAKSELAAAPPDAPFGPVKPTNLFTPQESPSHEPPLQPSHEQPSPPPPQESPSQELSSPPLPQESTSPPQELQREPPQPSHQESCQEQQRRIAFFASAPKYKPIVSPVINKDSKLTIDDFLSTSPLPLHAATSPERMLLALSRHRDEARKHKIHRPGGLLRVFYFFP
jgi:hypothetical protein